MNSAFIQSVGSFRWLARTAIRQTYKRLLRKEHSMVLATGEKFLLPLNSPFASEAYITGGDVDWGSEARFHECLAERGVFLDVGANIGYYSLYMCRKAEHVVAFEPDPRTVSDLRRNVHGRSNIEVVESAVGAFCGTARFTLETQGEISHLASAQDVHTSRQVEVPITTVDAFIHARGYKVAGMKTDVEGFDLDVLKGAARTLQFQRPVVLSEISVDEALFDFAASVGYRLFAFVRSHQNVRDVKYVEIAKGEPRLWTKMVFLVPEENAWSQSL